MQINRCISCENEIENYPCPHCGFDRAAYQQPEYALPCGTVLNGRYLVGKVLGQGGFGITYVGWDFALEIKVAIKEYYPNGQVTRSASGTTLNWYTNAQAEALRQNGMETFLREARKMAKVDAIPEVVRVRDTFIGNETAYIVMDFVEGRTLKDRLEKGGILSWEEAKKIFLPTIAAMEQVHQAGLIHRDMSPDNLMLTPDGKVKILDLGAAKDLTVNNGVSSMQVIKGGFSPIEQYGSTGDSGPWTDVYAIAATMYYSLTGKVPPTAPDRLGAFINQKEDSLEWELPQLKALPKNILQALQKALVVSVQKRTQSMGDLLRQVQDAPKQKTENKKKTKEKKPTSKALRLVAVVAAAALVGSVAFSLIPPYKTPQLDIPMETTTEATEASTPAPFTSLSDVSEWKDIKSLAAGNRHTVGLRKDGTVVAVGDNAFGQCEVNDWTDIIAVEAGEKFTVGLKKNGSVMIASDNKHLFTNVSRWTNVAYINAKRNTVVGIKNDGTVLISSLDMLPDSMSASLRYQNISSLAIMGRFNSSDSDEMVCLHFDGTVEHSTDYANKHWDTRHWSEIISLDGGQRHIVGLRENGTVVAEILSIYNDSNGRLVKGEELFGECNVDNWEKIEAISVGLYHTVGLKSDGTVVATGKNDNGRCSVESWKNIVAIDAGVNYTVGLKKDGTVVCTEGQTLNQRLELSAVPLSAGGNITLILDKNGNVKVAGTYSANLYSMQEEFSSWDDVVAVSAGSSHAVGLRRDGTVIATKGDVFNGKANIVAISAAERYTVGLLSDGTVIAEGENGIRQCNVESWSDIVAISARGDHTVGLKADGTVVATGGNRNGQCEVSEWNNIIAVSAGGTHTVGLRSDGTVVATGNNGWCQCQVGDWTDIIAISAGGFHTLGLKSDGTVVATGSNSDGQCNVESWSNIAFISAGNNHSVGMKMDESYVASGRNAEHQCNVN